MRRWMLAVLMIPLLLLSACGSGETNDLQVPLDFRALLLAADSCGFTADMQVDVQGKLYQIVLDCVCYADGTTEMTVRAPASLEGIQATWNGSNGLLSFDGMAVDFGLLADQSLAPITLPAVMAEHWRSAYILAAGQEDGKLHVTYEDDASDMDLYVDTWFEEGAPVYAEISLNGAVVAELQLTNLQLNGG